MSENSSHLPDSGVQSTAAIGPQPMYMTQSPQQVEAEKASQMSLLFGILGFFILGIVFGPLALIQAKKAERLGKAATVGKVLGWITTIWGVLWLVGFFIMVASGTAFFMSV